MEKRYIHVERRGRKCLFCSSMAFIISLSLALIQIYLLPAYPMPQLVMTIFVVLYVLLVEKRDLKSLGISAQNIKESTIAGLVVGAAEFLYIGIGIIMLYCDLGLPEAFAYLFNNFNPAPRRILHYLYVGFSEEIIFRGFLQRRFLESMKPTHAILSIALLFALIHIGNYPLSLWGILTCLLNLLGGSLIMGYLMYRTDNILSVGLLHTVEHFVELVGGYLNKMLCKHLCCKFFYLLYLFI